MKKNKAGILLTALVLVVLGVSSAQAVLPSGNGQTDMAHSVSVAIASNQTAVPVSGTITATVDTSALATSALQSTINTSLGTINTSLGLLTQPKSTTAVTVSDATDTTAYCGKGIWIGVGGDVAVKMLSDSAAVTLKNVPSGTFVAGQMLRVMSTNTTATNIICFGGTG